MQTEIPVKKIYILDTSVLVYDPMSFKSFNDNIVIIPITVLEELDKLKKFFDETGKNARTVIRTLDGLLPNNKDIEKGIKLENNILLKIDHNTEEDKSLGTFLYGDNRILSCALKLNKINRTEKVVLISSNIFLRLSFVLLAARGRYDPSRGGARHVPRIHVEP